MAANEAAVAGLQQSPAPPVVAGNDSTSTTPAHTSIFRKSYGTVVITLENVLIPPDKINPSPSALDGLDEETETFLRVGGCELIQTSGILLKLPQTAMATGQVLFQRFYYSKSFVRQPMEVTAMACVYLASKIEEAPRRIRDVINVFHHIRQYRAGKIIQPMILDPSYVRLKNDVMLAERRVLKELGFCVHVKHPHKIIVIYLQQLGYDQDKNFVQMSWNYMNDALRTNVFVRFKPEAIACACIFLSARLLKIPLPVLPNWYCVFDVTDSEVTEIATNIISLYDRPPIIYEELEKKVDALAKAYQELRDKGKSVVLGQKEEKTGAETPESKPNTPGREIPEITITSSKSTKDKERDRGTANGKRALGDAVNGDSASKKVVQKDREGSRSPKRQRRSPSPIIFNNNSSAYSRNRSRSPGRHKHKKRKKYSRQSSSRSPSRSRSPHRRSSKKSSSYRRRTPSPDSSSNYHKKKSNNYSDRYKSNKRTYS